jgi:FdhD protein
VRGDDLVMPSEALAELPDMLAAGQKTFAGTGSVHAAVLFTASGLCSEVYEDVGRHNAVDKLIGSRLLAARLPLWNTGLFVSGRSSFELVQKARMAGCAMLAAVGAPSSLAVELAWESDMTLVGFVRDGRFNVYAGPARIV